MLDEVEGCRGLSMLVDRETGQCIATSSWDEEEAMARDPGRLLRSKMIVGLGEVFITVQERRLAHEQGRVAGQLHGRWGAAYHRLRAFGLSGSCAMSWPTADPRLGRIKGVRR